MIPCSMKIQYHLTYRDVFYGHWIMCSEKKNGITKLNIRIKILIWFNLAVQNYSILVPTSEFALTDL